MIDNSLIKDIERAEVENGTRPHCDACDLIDRLRNTDPFEAVSRALGGTIGTSKLSAILTKNGHPVGRRAIQRHRDEGHTV